MATRRELKRKSAQTPKRSAAKKATAEIPVYRGTPDGSQLRLAVVVAQFNQDITDKLLEGALDTFAACGVKPANLTVVQVPGAWELPATAQALIERAPKTKRLDGVLALGAVIRGGTPHFDYVCNETSRGLMDVGLTFGIPVVFGVLTTDTVKQAKDRTGGALGNKGSETALATVEMANLFREL